MIWLLEQPVGFILDDGCKFDYDPARLIICLPWELLKDKVDPKDIWYERLWFMDDVARLYDSLEDNSQTRTESQYT